MLQRFSDIRGAWDRRGVAGGGKRHAGPVARGRSEAADAGIEAQFARFQEVLRAVRDIRPRQGVAPKTPFAFSVRCDAAVADSCADGALFCPDGQRPGDGLWTRRDGPGLGAT